MNNAPQQATEVCLLCRKTFNFGGGSYRGRYFRQWKASICEGCCSANHDGIVPTTYPWLVPHLKTIGVEIVLNEKGWIPLPR